MSNGLDHLNMSGVDASLVRGFRRRRHALAAVVAAAPAPGPAVHAHRGRRARSTRAALIATHYRVEPRPPLPVGRRLERQAGSLPAAPPRRGPMPTAVLFHGGGWVTGRQGRDRARRAALPGDGVRGRERRLPAGARGDGAGRRRGQPLRAALGHPPRASSTGSTPSQLILVGSSAGAHLALMAALAPASAGFDGLCPGDEPLKVAAVINFFGVIDVGELLGAAARARLRGRLDRQRRPTPRRWPGGSRPSPTWPRGRRRRRSSPPMATPIRWCRSRRRAGCTRRSTRPGVPNQLFPLRGGQHGEFDGNDVLLVNRAVRDFLVKHGVLHRGESELLQ